MTDDLTHDDDSEAVARLDAELAFFEARLAFVHAESPSLHTQAQSHTLRALHRAVERQLEAIATSGDEEGGAP